VPTTRAVGARRSGVDVRGALGLVGLLSRYLAVAVVFPIAVALHHDEPFWPFAAAGLGLAGSGYVLGRWGRDVSRVGAREGFLVVALT
jgi:hypothetical protein